MMEKPMLNSGAGTAERRSQIKEGMEVLNAAVQSTMDSIQELERRLYPVLIRNEPSPACGWGLEDAQPLVPLANELRDLHVTASGSNVRVIDILQRLEL